MTKKQIISLVVSVIIVITAISIWFPNRNTPFKYWFKDATNFQECSEASGVILESYPEQCVFKGKSFSNPDQHVDVPDQESKLKTFVDPQGLYSFKYPSDILTFKTEFRPIPFYTNAQQEETAIFSHTINAEYCNLAGNCKPTTTDLEISAIVVDAPLASLKKAKLGDLDPTEDLVTNTEIPATYEVTFVEIGAEGEGINYYSISLNDKQTLVISKKYLNENILTSYQNNPDFIPFFEQGRIVINIIESLKIIKTQTSAETESWKTYTSTKYGFSFKYPPTFISNGQEKYIPGNYDNLNYSGPIFNDNNIGSIFPIIREEKFDQNNIQGLYGRITDYTKVSIGNKTGYLYSNGDGGCGGQEIQTGIGNRTLIFRFVSCEDGGPKKQIDFVDNPPLIKDILSTFIFTN